MGDDGVGDSDGGGHGDRYGCKAKILFTYCFIDGFGDGYVDRDGDIDGDYDSAPPYHNLISGGFSVS